MKSHNQVELEDLAKTLPPLIPRHCIGDYLPGIISPGHLANLDSQRCGPKRLKIGSKVVYTREDLLAWLAARIRYDSPASEEKNIDR